MSGWAKYVTETDLLRQNSRIVQALGQAISDGEHGLEMVPSLLKRVLKENRWREFVTDRDVHVSYERFEEFAGTPPTRGLGTSVALIRRIVAPDKEALDLLDRALQRRHGGDRKSEDSEIKIDNINFDPVPDGTSESNALRRLRKDRPDLHERVVNGEMKANSAMKEAGFRPHTFTVRADRPEAIVATLRKQLTPEVLEEVVALLVED